MTEDVVIIGGGPAGVAAALSLRQAGVERVTLIDREAELGGATRHCLHSPFGMLEYGRVYMGAAYGRRLGQDIAKAGVNLRTRTTVTHLGADGDIAITSDRGTDRLSARRVLVATGAREMPRSARMLPGDRPLGVLTTGTLQAYVAFHGLMPFRRPLIVGSELVSQSAILTCLMNGARPVAMVEPGPALLVRAPFRWLPRVTGIPVLKHAQITDIRGRDRVEMVEVAYQGQVRRFDCDGVLLTGQFTPETTLLRMAGFDIAPGNNGAEIDQQGRSQNPIYFAAGNVLRPVETAGWSFREGRAIGRMIAQDLALTPVPTAEPPLPVRFDSPVKLVVPGLIRRTTRPGMDRFQLRFAETVRGRLSLDLDGKTVWSQSDLWHPERRVLVPLPNAVQTAGDIRFRFTPE